MGSLAEVRKHLRILDWALLGAFAGALLLFLGDMGCFVAGGGVARFDPFGRTVLDRYDGWVAPALGCLWLAWAVQTLVRAGRRGLDARSLIIVYFFSLMALWVSVMAWQSGLAFLNGLLDFGPKNTVDVMVRDWHEIKIRSYRWGDLTDKGATVSRADHPDERVGIAWVGCDLPKGVDPSPHAAIVMGRGAFGAPWYRPHVICRALQIDEHPLFKSFRVGRGRPIAIFALSEQDPERVEWDRKRARDRDLLLNNLAQLAEGDVRMYQGQQISWPFDTSVGEIKRHLDDFDDRERAVLEGLLEQMRAAPRVERRKLGQDALAYAKQVIGKHTEGTMVAAWLDALEASGADPEIALVRRGRYRGLPTGVSCKGCRVLARTDLDERIVRLLPGVSDLWADDDWRLLVADGKGRPLFKGNLTDTRRIPELARALATPPASGN